MLWPPVGLFHQRFEPAAQNLVGLGHHHKGMGVQLVDLPLDDESLTGAHSHHQHTALSAAVHAGAVQLGNGPVQPVHQVLRNLRGVAVGDHKAQVPPVKTAHNVVGKHAAHIQRDDGVQAQLHIPEGDHGKHYGGPVNDHAHFAHAHLRKGHHQQAVEQVGSAHRTVGADEAHHADAVEHPAEQAGHQRVGGQGGQKVRQIQDGAV